MSDTEECGISDSSAAAPSLNDCVQVREHDGYIHVDIGGRTKEMQQIYGSLYERVQAVEDKTVAELRPQLTKSRVTPSKTRFSKGFRNSGSDIEPAPAQSPSALLKGPSPSSSTVGKRIVGSKAQPTQSISPEVVTDGIVSFEKNCPDLDTITSKASPASKSIAECTTEEQIIVTVQQSNITTTMEQSNESAIVACQSVSTTSTMMITRSRSSQAKTNMTRINASKTVSKSVLKSCKSASRSITTTRKVQQQQPNCKNKLHKAVASSKSMSKAKTAPLNQRLSASSLNVGSQSIRTLVEHGRSSVGTGTLKKVGSLNKCTSTANKPNTTTHGPTTLPPNVTPKRMPARVPLSSAQPSTPSTVAQQQRRNRELESARYEQLTLSVDKRKKAEENKKALLDQRINGLKLEREKRLEKIRENKFALKIEKNKKRKAGETIGHSAIRTVAPSTPTVTNMTKAEARNVERRQKLAQLQLEQDIMKNCTSGPAKTINKENAAVKKVYMKPKFVPKNLHSNKDGNEKQWQPQEKQHNETISELKCTSEEDSNGAIANVPTAVTPLVPANGSATLKAKLLNECANTYEMTPPPQERACDPNLDIIKYIEQDYEAEAVYEAAKDGKKIPKWAQGKEFARLVEEQFSMPSEQLNQWTSRIFSGPVLPVPLEEMGLGVVKVKQPQLTTQIQAQKQ